MDKQILKTQLKQQVKNLAYRAITTVILTLTAVITVWVYAAFIEPLVGPNSSDQDFAQNILGNNDANNDFSSSDVASNADGSIIEREEYLQNKIGTYADATTTPSAASSVFAGMKGLDKPRWAGYSGTATLPTTGTKGMNERCNTAYSGSHACTYEEIIQLGTSYPYTSGAWLINGSIFTNQAGTSAQLAKDGKVYTTVGATTPMCAGWTDNTGGAQGPYISNAGYISFNNCNEGAPLPCCF